MILKFFSFLPPHTENAVGVGSCPQLLFELAASL
jgi:hypothetical protein